MVTSQTDAQSLSPTVEKISVLLVDDNPTFLEIGKMFLETRCSEFVGTIFVASNGNDAIALAQTHCPQLILLDVSMPNMNGLETATHLKKILPESHIIMLTLLETLGYHQAALAAGADELIDKENITTDLMPTIQRIMHPTR